MDTRKIVDYAIDDEAKEMRESLYASIYDRVQSAFEAKKQEMARSLLGMGMAAEETDHEGHEDEAADKKLVKKMVKKSALKTEEEQKAWMKKKAKKMAKKMMKKHMEEQAELEQSAE